MNAKIKWVFIILLVLGITYFILWVYSGSVDYRPPHGVYWESLYNSSETLDRQNQVQYDNITQLYTASDARNKADYYLRELQNKSSIINYTITSSERLVPYWSGPLCKDYFDIRYDTYVIDWRNMTTLTTDNRMRLCDGGQIAIVLGGV